MRLHVSVVSVHDGVLAIVVYKASAKYVTHAVYCRSHQFFEKKFDVPQLTVVVNFIPLALTYAVMLQIVNHYLLYVVLRLVLILGYKQQLSGLLVWRIGDIARQTRQNSEY